MREAVVVDAVRTPMGRLQGGMFRNVRAENLSASVIQALLDRNPKVNPAEIEDVIWAASSRPSSRSTTSALRRPHDLDPKEVPAQTINRLCGSSMQALHAATLAIKAEEGDLFVVGASSTWDTFHDARDRHQPAMSKRVAKGSMNMGITASSSRRCTAWGARCRPVRPPLRTRRRTPP